MNAVSYDRYCSEIVAQTALLARVIEGADLTMPVPSCPGWNVGQLLRHLGGGQRWAAEIVRTEAAQPPSDAYFRDLSAYANEDPTVLAPWLTESAALLAGTLRDAGPGATMWTPLPGRTAHFYARRFTHETVIHRADAVLAVGVEYALGDEIALDAVDEWMELGSLPMHLDVNPRIRELLGPGRTVHLHATDMPPEAAAEWLIDLTGDTITWRRARADAAVSVGGPLTDLLLVLYKRLPVRSDGIEIAGDAALLDFWLERVDFG